MQNTEIKIDADCQKQHFFSQLLLNKAIVFTQNFNAKSFLLGNIVYRKQAEHAQLLPEAFVFRSDYSLLKEIYEQKEFYKDQSIFIADPWVSLKQCRSIAPHVKNLYFASSSFSHYEEYKALEQRIPSNMKVFIALNKDVFKIAYEKCFLEPMPQYVKTIAEQVEDSKVQRPFGAVLEMYSNSHIQFLKEYPNFDLSSIGKQCNDAYVLDITFGRVIDETVIVNHKKLKALYLSEKFGNQLSVGAFMRNSASYAALGESHGINLVIYFFITSEAIYYRVMRTDGQTNVLDFFSHYDPVGNEHSATISLPITEIKNSIILRG